SVSAGFVAVVFGAGFSGASGSLTSGADGAVDGSAGCCLGGCCFGACDDVGAGSCSTDIDPPVAALEAVGAVYMSCCSGGIAATLASIRPGRISRWPFLSA